MRELMDKKYPKKEMLTSGKKLAKVDRKKNPVERFVSF